MTATIHSEGDLRVLRALARRIDPGDAGAHNNLGVVYYQKGLYEEAIEQFRRALAIDGKMEVARRNLDIAYHQTGYYDRRIAELIARLRADESDLDARAKLAEAYLSTGKLDEAIAQLERLFQKRPDDLRILLKLGAAEKSRGELKRAIGWFERARQLEPQRGFIYYSLGEILYNQGMNDEAIAHLRKALKLDPEVADAHRLLSFIYGDIGEVEKAAEHARRAAELNPAAMKAQANLSLDHYSSARYIELTGSAPTPVVGHKEAFAHYSLGIAFRARGLYEEARQEFAKGREAGEDETLLDQAEAELALLEGDAEGALALYDALADRMADSPKVWNERGVTLHQMGRLDEAEDSYRRALKLDGKYALAWNNVGVLSAHRNNAATAERAFNRALDAKPEFDDARLNLGLLWVKTGRSEAGVELYREMLDADATRADAWTGLGTALMGQEQFVEARNALARAVECLGEHEGALRETKRALEMDPYYTSPRYKLSIDLQYEGGEVWAPELAAPERIEPRGPGVRGFHFDPGELDSAFKALDAPELARGEPRLEARPLLGETGISIPDPRTLPAGSRAADWASVGAAPPREESMVEPVAVPSEDRFAEAREHLAHGLYERAMRVVARIVRQGGDAAEGAIIVGGVFLQRGLYGEALERFDEALSRRPGSADALLGRTRCLLELDRVEEALAAAEQLEPITDGHTERLLTVGEVFVKAGKGKRALRALQAAVQAAPRDPVVQRQMARAALALGNRRKAREAYRLAIAEDPDFAAARVELARILMDEGAYAEAESEIRDALELMPAYAEASLVLADLLRRQGRTRETINLLATLLEVEPYNLDALVMLGEALAKEGRRKDAQQALQRVLHFDPERPVALFRMGELSAEAGRYRDALDYWRQIMEVAPDSDYADRARVQARAALGRGAAPIAARSGA